MSVRPWLYHAICISLPRQPTADQGRTRPREVSQKSGAPFGRYSRLWLALTTAADCSPTLIVTELRLTIEANAIRQLVPPEAFNAVRRQRRVTRRVLEIAVPEVRLQRPRVDAVLSSLTLQTCRSICACALILRLASKLAQAKWDSVSSQIQHRTLESNRRMPELSSGLYKRSRVFCALRASGCGR